MTWAQILSQIMARFDALDQTLNGLRGDLEDIHNRVVTLEDRTAEVARAEDIEALRAKLNDLDVNVSTLGRTLDDQGNVGEALYLLDELADAERRRERAEMLAGARAAMRVAS